MDDAHCLCLPQQPVFRSTAEKRVWEALRTGLRDCDVLLHGVHFSDQGGDSEVDLIVLMPEGFATIEVKGGRVWFEDGLWRQSTPEGIKDLDLENQAIGHKHRVGKYLAARWPHGRPRMQHLVALPDVAVADADPSPGLPRGVVIDRNGLREAAGIVFDSLNDWMFGQPVMVPGDGLVAEASGILAGRGDPQERLAHRLSAVEEEVRRLTEEQFLVLETAERIPRVEVSGGPGTGKTWLAVEQARRWTQQGQNVGFLCYSRGLAGWVRRLVAAWPDKQQKRLWIGTFHALGRQWGVRIPDGLAPDDSQFWDVDFLAQMAGLAGSAEPRFDALVVDEAQDFSDKWWPILVRGLRDSHRGRLMVFSDERQRVFDRTAGPLEGLVPLQVRRNMRNSRQIARIFQPLADDRQELIGLEGPEVRFIPCSGDDAVGVADDAAVALLDEGWQPRDVALLTTHHRHPMHRELTRDGKDDYWSLLWDNDDIFYSTVAGFKGLERQAVVLAVDGFRTPDVARQVLFVGLSRAREMLVVCGDPEALHEAGGKELVKRLQARAGRTAEPP